MNQLDENKKLYMNCADINLPGWQKLSKSQLCEIYINSEDKRIKEGAVSAIIYKCWNIFWHNYRNQPYIPLEDWYESMIEAIMYVLKSHVWTNSNNILFNKPNGPEMALHRCIWSRKLNVYGLNKKPKRVINLNLMSTEDLYERVGIDLPCEINEDKYIFVEYIRTLIQKGKLEYAIILDLIFQGLPSQKLVREIKQLDTNYSNAFSKIYSVEQSKVDNTINTMQNNKNLSQYLEYYITCLQRDQDTIDYLT